MSDYKDEIDRLNRELQEVKKKFYDQKKREMIQQDQVWARDSWGSFMCTVWVLVVEKKNDLGMRMQYWINGPQVQQPPVEMRRILLKFRRVHQALFATNPATPPTKPLKHQLFLKWEHEWGVGLTCLHFCRL